MNKKKVLRNVLFGIAGAVGVLGLVIASRPSTFHVERSITIAAPPERAFALVNDLHAWTTWSPYEKLDPQMKRTFDGAASGVGAAYAWSGNDKAGEGRMTIQESEKPSRIAIRLEFMRPFACVNQATFTFTPSAEGTHVTWAMDGENNFISKTASLVFDMDKLVGSDFEHGLSSMKSIAENAPNATADNAGSAR
ncbi:MAG TPA: SRPBCC family protein [Labilithrix sp.]|jgi:uncharacterized protein YndB with AHSA1/START domain|nr:SRPBCC family protein [Labilithrix sp.]